MNKSIVVVGGGVTGLTAAYSLIKMSAQKGLRLKVHLLEGEHDPGGKICTERKNGYLLELGPDTIHDPAGMAFSLITELGLADDIITPLRSGHSVLHNNRLHSVSSGIMGSPAQKARAILATDAISLSAKFRAVLGSFIRGSQPGIDISIADYCRAKWGDEFSQILLEPLLAGIHGGRGQKLSMLALYPHLMDDQLHLKNVKQKSTFQESRPRIFTLKNGLSTLTQKLKEKLPKDTVITGTRVKSIDPSHSEGVQIKLEDGNELIGSVCVLATPAYESSKLLALSSPEVAGVLSSITFSSTVVVTTGISTHYDQKVPYGNGVISTGSSGSMISACTWSSLKWAGRSPKAVLLSRSFLHSGMGKDFLKHSDQGLKDIVASELGNVLRTKVDPLFTHVKRWHQAFPQYELGHVGKVKKLEEYERQNPQLLLCGASYRGGSITSCVRDAQRAAKKAFSSLLQNQSEENIAISQTEGPTLWSSEMRKENLQNA